MIKRSAEAILSALLYMRAKIWNFSYYYPLLGIVLKQGKRGLIRSLNMI